MQVLGLVGGIATGKSSAAKFFLKNGIPVFSADKAVKSLYKHHKTVRRELMSLCPRAIISNRLDWKFLREYALSSPDHLVCLENLLHPYVKKLMYHFLEYNRKLGVRAVVLDIPLLLETDTWKICSDIVWIRTDLNIRVKRALDRNTLSMKQLSKIIQRQADDTRFRCSATKIIDSSRGLVDLESSISSLAKKL